MKKFFISSTFQDMHAERDLIQNIVQPAINSRLSDQGEYLSFSDLRWGIDVMTEDTERKILDACFDEIVTCKPYFLVFIGGRYGWIPDESLVSHLDRFDGLDILGKSVTELEVLYALKLNVNNLNRCLFYFKDDADFVDEGRLTREEVKDRIDNLKRKIESVAPSQIRHYKPVVDAHTEETLADQLVSDICGILAQDKPVSWRERVENQMKVKFETSLPGLSSQWLDRLEDTSIDLAVLLFTECKVKESLITNFASKIKCLKPNGFVKRLFCGNKKETNSIYVNVGATKEISDTLDLLRYLICQIGHVCELSVPQIENQSAVKLKGILSSLLTQYTKDGNKLYLIISEYDKLIDAQDTRWLPDFIENVVWVVSLSDKSIAESLPSSTHKKTIYGHKYLGSVPFDEQISAYEKWSNKTLNSRVKDAIKQLPYANDYLMLEVIFNRLMHIDGKEIPDGDTGKIPQYMEQFIKTASEFNEPVRYFLNGDYRKFDERLCEFIIVCMAFLKRGLTIYDIERIAQKMGISWTELDIIRFLNYESFLLTQYEDGRYDISSSALADRIVKSYFLDFQLNYSAAIYDYLKGLPDLTSVKIDNYWFLCYNTNHFKEFIDYLKSLYDIRKDNSDIKSAFLPIFSNVDAKECFLQSFRKERLQYESTDFIAELVSIVTHTYSKCNVELAEEFVAATKNVEDISGDLRTEFRRHYSLAMCKIGENDYAGFVEEFNICLDLSHKQFKANPPQLQCLDGGQMFVGSYQDMLDHEFGFSFVEEMAALMGKYGDLPKCYQDEKEALYYAETSQSIRTKISKITYILPKDIDEIRKGNAESVKRTNPSLLRGEAVDLSKQAYEEKNPDLKIQLWKESIAILDKILAMPEDDLVGEFKDSQLLQESAKEAYEESYRDRALVLNHLSSILVNEKFELLSKAYSDIMQYAKTHNNDQVRHDILGIAQKLAAASYEVGNFELCIGCCVKAYEAFAELKPKNFLVFFDIDVDSLIIKATVDQPDLQDVWVSECKRMINSFQSVRASNSMLIIVTAFYQSLKHYVIDEGIEKHTGLFIYLIETMACQVINMIDANISMDIYNSAVVLLDKTSIKGNECLALLNTLCQYAIRLVKSGKLDEALEKSKQIEKISERKYDGSEDFKSLIYRIKGILAQICIDTNNVSEAQQYIDSIVEKYEKDFEKYKTLDLLINYAVARFNQVMLWDKTAADDIKREVLPADFYACRAQRALSDMYILCRDFSEKSERKAVLMRRIRRTLEVIKDKGLGYLSSPEITDSIKRIKLLSDEITQAQKAGNAVLCIEKCRQIVAALNNGELVDIYFEPDQYAGCLYLLAKDASSKGLTEQAEQYYKEAIQIRYELEADGISQNKDNFALLLYFYSLILLRKPKPQDSISLTIQYLNKAMNLFWENADKLCEEYRYYYSSCCFNLGHILCLFTTEGRRLGLPMIKTAIGVMDRLIKDYGQIQYKRDKQMFEMRYAELDKMLK